MVSPLPFLLVNLKIAETDVFIPSQSCFEKGVPSVPVTGRVTARTSELCSDVYPALPRLWERTAWVSIDPSERGLSSECGAMSPDRDSALGLH